VIFMPWQVYPKGRVTQYPLNQRIGLIAVVDTCNESNLAVCWNETGSCHVTNSLGAIPTSLQYHKNIFDCTLNC
jgi:hypothetical protein